MSERSEKPRAVVDTNLIVRGLISKLGAAFALLESLRQERFILLFSGALELEYRDVLARPVFTEKYGLTEQARADFFSLIETSATLITPASSLPVQVRDPKDEKVLAAALGGHAEYVVTSDDDLLELRDDPRLGNLRIVTVGEFLDVLRS